MSGVPIQPPISGHGNGAVKVDGRVHSGRARSLRKTSSDSWHRASHYNDHGEVSVWPRDRVAENSRRMPACERNGFTVDSRKKRRSRRRQNFGSHTDSGREPFLVHTSSKNQHQDGGQSQAGHKQGRISRRGHPPQRQQPRGHLPRRYASRGQRQGRQPYIEPTQIKQREHGNRHTRSRRVEHEFIDFNSLKKGGYYQGKSASGGPPRSLHMENTPHVRRPPQSPENSKKIWAEHIDAPPSSNRSKRWECLVCGHSNWATAVCSVCDTARGRLAHSSKATRRSLATAADLARIGKEEEEEERREEQRRRIIAERQKKREEEKLRQLNRQKLEQFEQLRKWVSDGCRSGPPAQCVLENFSPQYEVADVSSEGLFTVRATLDLSASKMTNAPSGRLAGCFGAMAREKSQDLAREEASRLLLLLLAKVSGIIFETSEGVLTGHSSQDGATKESSDCVKSDMNKEAASRKRKRTALEGEQKIEKQDHEFSGPDQADVDNPIVIISDDSSDDEKAEGGLDLTKDAGSSSSSSSKKHEVDLKPSKWDLKAHRAMKKLAEDYPTRLRESSEMFKILRNALVIMDNESYRRRLDLPSAKSCSNCLSTKTQIWRRKDRWGRTCRECKTSVLYGSIAPILTAPRKKLRRQMSKDELKEAIDLKERRKQGLRNYHNSIREMNEKIEEWHAKAQAMQQQRLFKQAASALPPNLARQQSNINSGQNLNTSGYRAFSRQDPMIENSFKFLELNPYATHDEVRQKFKELALRYHPDRSSNDTADVFRRILQARETLEEFFMSQI